MRDEVRAGLLHGVQERAEAGVHDELPRGVLAQLPGGSRLRSPFEGLQTGASPVLCEQPGGRALREVRADSEDRVRERSEAELPEGSQPGLQPGAQAELHQGAKAELPAGKQGFACCQNLHITIVPLCFFLRCQSLCALQSTHRSAHRYSSKT